LCGVPVGRNQLMKHAVMELNPNTRSRHKYGVMLSRGTVAVAKLEICPGRSRRKYGGTWVETGRRDGPSALAGKIRTQ
jgi:hypothetical protein